MVGTYHISALLLQWCEHVCYVDGMPALHCGAVQHHRTPRQDAGEQDEPDPRPPL